MENGNKLNIELIKQSKPNKITSTGKIKWQRLREDIANTRTTQCYQRGVVNNPLKNQVGIHE